MSALHALLLEDDENDAILVGHILRHAGYDLQSRRVEHPDEFEQALREQRWDIVIADFNLREFTGLDAVRTAREIDPDLPVIVVSGAIGEEMAARLMREGARDFVGKHNLSRLAPAIDRELHEGEERRARQQAEKERAESERREMAALGQVRAAHELDRLRTLFIHTISHELRNPLTSIMGFLDLLADGSVGPLTPAQQDYVQRAAQGAKRMRQLVDDLLDYARVDAGVFHVQQHATDMAALVRQAVAEAGPEALTAQVSLTTVTPPEPVVAAVDARRITQVLANLLGNAIRFSPPGGTVTVRLCESRERVTMEVEDDGPGVPPEQRAKLFTLFAQIEGGGRKAGTGLGLAIAKSIVEAHGGAIGLRATGPGGRTTFFVDLPRHLAE